MGVPVHGTPWHFIARMAEENTGHFVPLCVNVYEDVAYAEGVITDPEEKNVVLVCSVVEGVVVDAWIEDDNR